MSGTFITGKSYPNWELGKPAAVALCIPSPLSYKTSHIACVMAGSAAMQAELKEHHSNDEKCRELVWVCIPLVVELSGCWGPEAQHSLLDLLDESPPLYGRLNMTPDQS